MNIVQIFNDCLAFAIQQLQLNESIVQFKLAQPLAVGSADYLTRFKACVGVVDGAAASVSNERCFVVTKSSNFGTIAIDTTTACDSIPDVW
jgi:hypothetical protein